MLILNISMLSFHLSVSKNLLSSNCFLLHRIKLFFLLFLLFHHACFSNLLRSFKSDLVDLLLVEAFKVIWLDSVWGQHADLSLRIFSHEVVIGGVSNFVSLLICPLLVLSDFSFFFFLSEKLINT